MNRRFVALLVLMSCLSLTACNTWRGLGQDIEHVGEKMSGKK